MPHSEKAGQSVLYGASVEGGEDGWRHHPPPLTANLSVNIVILECLIFSI